MTAQQALAALKLGNRRFAENRPAHPNQTRDRRAQISAGQSPFAAVLACSDSRRVPEIIFDQGLGDLFVIRVAGNVVDEVVLESLDFSSAHFGYPLIVVLGHTRCGAVTAALSTDSAEVRTRTLRALLHPAVETARGRAGDPVTNAVHANVRIGVERLGRSTINVSGLREPVGPRVVGAVYDIDTGWVEWTED